MPAFDLPLSVRVHADPASGRPAAHPRLVLQLPGPTRWSAVAAHVCVAAGLPTTTVLHLGPGPVQDQWLVGHPPLLAGVVLDTRPDPTPRVSGLMELACIAGPDAGRSVPLLDEPVVIGRDPAAGLPVADPELSFRHAEIRLTEAGPQVDDLGSTNGIVVDGGRRPGGAALPVGSILRLGSSLFQVRLAVEAPATRVPDGLGSLLVTPSARLPTPWSPTLPAAPGPVPTRQRRPLPLIAVVVGAGLGAVLAAVTGSLLFLAFAALGPVTILATALADRVGGRRSHRSRLAAHAAAVRRHRRALAQLARADRIDDWDAHPDPAACLARIERCAARLWERDATAPDVGVVLVGHGSRPLRRPDGPSPPSSRPPGEVPGPVTDAPITVDLRQLAALGIVGPPQAVAGLLRSVLLQALALHPPGVVVLRGFALDPRTAHTAAPAVAGSLVIENGAGGAREQGAGGGTAAADGPGHRVRVFTALSTHLLPAGCDVVLRVGAGRLRVLGAQAGHPDGTARPIGIGPQLLTSACTALAPLVPGSAGPPTSGNPLSDRHDPAGQRADWDPERWRRPSASAVLGVGPAGAVRVDLDTDGPHLLIAGTTGSGKSELLLTLAAGLAAAAPPSHTSLLLVDYKGGAGFAGLAELPHVVATLTDLDQATAERGLAGLRAELRRREHILSAAGAPDLATLRAAGSPDAPARLVVMVDEFATLAAELPDFLTGLIDIAQRGRSLGLHLVLATQRPGGVVGPAIRANITTRICLRVVDDAESRDVLGVPDAAWLDPARPGQALLRVASGSLKAFRVIRLTEAVRTGVRVYRVDDGAPAGHDGALTTTAPTRLAVLVSAWNDAAAALRAADPARILPRAPWLPALPTRLRIEDPTAIGLVDLPEIQHQPVLTVPGSLVIAGPPGSGRSTALLRWARAAAATGSDLLVVDPAGALAGLAADPATATWLDAGEPVPILRLLDRLVDRLRQGSDADGPALALVIDGWESVAAAVDRYDPGTWTGRLADVITRGPGSGVRVALAGGPALLHHRLAVASTEMLLLGAPDHRGQWRPGALPGRGRRHGGTGPELQIALPGTGPLPTGPAAATGDPPPATPDRAHRLVIRPLPPRVRRDDPGLADLVDRADRIVLGVGGDDARPVTIDLGQSVGLVIAGGPRSGVSTAVDTVADGAVRAGIPTLVVRPSSPAAGGDPDVVPVGCAIPAGSATDPAAAGLLPAARSEMYLTASVDPLRRILDRHTGPLVLAVDGFAPPFGAIADLLDDLLLTYLRVAVPGQVLVLGSRIDAAVRVGTRGALAAALGRRRILLLQPDPADARLLGATIPRVPEPARPGRGHLVDGTTFAVQVTLPAVGDTPHTNS